MLLTFSKAEIRCKTCAKGAELRLSFPYGLEAGAWTYKVLDAFSPDEPESWDKQDGSKVTFYPFLVVMGYVDNPVRTDNGFAFWFPYWHIEQDEKGTVKRKYGQWAPCLDHGILTSLLGQARRKGYVLS
jgi:hypothetical protein